MVERERDLGVTEARFALTLLTCFLVAVGYIVLLRLAGGKDPALDAAPDDVTPPVASAPAEPQANELQPHVLPLESPRDAVPRTSQRPNRPPQNPPAESEIR